MAGSITIDLPVQSYLKKFLVKQYGCNLIVNRNSLLGLYIINLLDNNYTKKGTIKNGFAYKITIPKTIINEVGFNLPPGKFNSLESWLDKLFRSHVFNYIEITIDNELLVNLNSPVYHYERKHGINKQDVIKAITQFFNSYDIKEEDFKFETMYRQFMRYQEKKNSKIDNIEKGYFKAS